MIRAPRILPMIFLGLGVSACAVQVSPTQPARLEMQQERAVAQGLMQRWQAALAVSRSRSQQCADLGFQGDPQAGACWGAAAQEYDEAARDFATWHDGTLQAPLAARVRDGTQAASHFFGAAAQWARTCAALPSAAVQQCNQPEVFARMKAEKARANEGFRSALQWLDGHGAAGGPGGVADQATAP